MAKCHVAEREFEKEFPGFLSKNYA